jgi:3-phenylpropionate/trans-cinnamate dioxygenase ferredoxin reductase subunit
MESQYDYVIVGGGLAGASAVLGIREHDIKGTVLLLGEEKHLPYDRPPLSKKLWFGRWTSMCSRVSLSRSAQRR